MNIMEGAFLFVFVFVSFAGSGRRDHVPDIYSLYSSSKTIETDAVKVPFEPLQMNTCEKDMSETFDF